LDVKPITETVLDTRGAFRQAIWFEWQGCLRTTRTAKVARVPPRLLALSLPQFAVAILKQPLHVIGPSLAFLRAKLLLPSVARLMDNARLACQLQVEGGTERPRKF
jgi:hypothetical protein